MVNKDVCLVIRTINNNSSQ